MRSWKRLTVLQQQEVLLGRQNGLSERDCSLYCHRKYNYLQMAEIRRGLENGLTYRQIRIYASASADYLQMEKMRKLLESGKTVHRAGRHHYGLTAAAVFCGFAVFLLAAPAEKEIPLSLQLRQNEVKLACNESFDPAQYVDSYTEDPDTQLILPETILTDQPGYQTAEYRLKRKDQEIVQTLGILIEDKTAPVLKLKQDTVSVKSGETFSCRAWIENAQDDTDGDLSSQVVCSSVLQPDQEKVLYQVSDSSGNQSSAWIHIEWIRPLLQKQSAPQPSAQPQENAGETAVHEWESTEIIEDSGWIYEEVGNGETEVTHTVE